MDFKTLVTCSTLHLAKTNKKIKAVSYNIFNRNNNNNNNNFNNDNDDNDDDDDDDDDNDNDNNNNNNNKIFIVQS